MTRILVLVFTVGMLFPRTLLSNPIALDIPVINEVQWISEREWTIELLAAELTTLQPPCTTTTVKIWFSSTDRTYSTRIYFDSSGLGIVTRESFTEIPDGEMVIVRQDEIIGIVDNSGAVPDRPGWTCALEDVESGHSMLYVNDGNYSESCRSSIGEQAVPWTKHKLYLVDRNGLPLSGIGAFRKKIQDDGCNYPIHIRFYREGTSDEEGCIDFDVSIGNDWPVILSYTAPHSYATECFTYDLTREDPVFPGWSCRYIDSLAESNDTVKILPSYHKVRVVDNKGDLQEGVQPHVLSKVPWKKLDTGEYLFTLFGSRYRIEFLNESDSAVVAACTCSYVDSDDTVATSVVALATPVHQIPDNKTVPRTRSDQLSVCTDASGSVRFVLSSEFSCNDAVLRICSINGKVVATLPVPSGAPGTRTVFWGVNDRRGRGIAPGKYLCNLERHGTAVLSRSVLITGR